MESSKLPKRRKHFLFDCEDDEAITPILTNNEIIMGEISIYTSLKADLDEDWSPLTFFKKNENVLPNLAKVAKMVFCTTASSVPSECLFSTAGDLISVKRTRLNPECAEDLLMLNKNKFI